MKTIGMVLILFGILTLVTGLFLYIAPSLPGFLKFFGSLPGDIKYEGKNTRIYIPLTSMILLSLFLTIAINIAIWLLKVFSRNVK